MVFLFLTFAGMAIPQKNNAQIDDYLGWPGSGIRYRIHYNSSLLASTFEYPDGTAVYRLCDFENDYTGHTIIVWIGRSLAWNWTPFLIHSKQVVYFSGNQTCLQWRMPIEGTDQDDWFPDLRFPTPAYLPLIMQS